MKNHSIHTEVIIDADLKRVWDCLSELGNYKLWNSFIHHFDGKLVNGETLGIIIHPLGKRSQIYNVKIIDYVPHKKVTWLGHFFIKGLIDGEHCFHLFSQGENKTRLVHKENFTGLLVPFVWESFILPRLIPGFLEFNYGLKKFLEKNCIN